MATHSGTLRNRAAEAMTCSAAETVIQSVGNHEVQPDRNSYMQAAESHHMHHFHFLRRPSHCQRSFDGLVVTAAKIREVEAGKEGGGSFV